MIHSIKILYSSSKTVFFRTHDLPFSLSIPTISFTFGASFRNRSIFTVDSIIPLIPRKRHVYSLTAIVEIGTNRFCYSFITNSNVVSEAEDKFLEDLFEFRRQQKEQEKFLNLTQLWIDGELVHLEEGKYIPSLLPPTFLPADVIYHY